MKTFATHIDENGRLIIPPEVAQNLGLITGIELMNEENEHSISVPRLITTLKRVYVEITNQCNLNCTTCMRNVWDVEFGNTHLDVFKQLLKDVGNFSPSPEIFLGGYWPSNI